jgi:hypothetical protein
MSDTAKVHEFLKGSRDVHTREIASGTGLALETVEAILETVVQAGMVTKIGEANVAIYNLAGVTVPEAPAPEPYVSREVRWSAEQHARVLAEEKSKQPKPSPRYQPTPEELEQELANTTTRPPSKEELEFLEVSTKNRRGVNPNAFIVK